MLNTDEEKKGGGGSRDNHIITFRIIHEIRALLQHQSIMQNGL